MERRRVRVLVVDDSAFTRKVIRELLVGSGQIEVVGIARDGLEALEKVVDLKPDVVTLDLMMPALDGLGFLNALPRHGGPRVIVVSSLELSSEKAVEALACGAVEVIHKPTALATDQLYELSAELVRTVLAHAPAASPSLPLKDEPRAPARASGGPCKLVLIGASTGGPQALVQVLGALPANFPVPLGVVLHLPIGYTAAFAKRLDESCKISVVEADDNVVFRPGLAVVARAGQHLKLVQRGGALVAALDYTPTHHPHRPAVDELFLSGAAQLGAGVLGVVLTGMGNDGLLGSRAIAAAGGVLLGEAQKSCIVYGMSRCLLEAGLGAIAVPLDEMAKMIESYV